MRRRYVGYIRVAHEDDSAVELQKSKIEYYAKKNNIQIDYYYIDNGYSGINLNRPQLKQLLRDVKSRKVTNEIIYTDNNRISRNKFDFSKIVRAISKSNVKLVSMIEEENVMTSMMTVMHKHYRDTEKKRMIIATNYYANKVKE
ncbi:MAG: recombinase family protein [Bacilli bacterium]|nr:recombinase family protein [Bacilli bacterium]